MPEVLVGARTVLDEEAARKCAAAGAQFLVTPGFNAPTVAAARELDLLIMAGALTPSEIMEASASGADFVKVFPCGSIGGPKYIQALRGPFPQIPLVPTGGVTLETTADYIRAGAAALGVGGEMIAKDAVKARDRDALSKLAALFVDLARDAQDVYEALRPIARKQPR